VELDVLLFNLVYWGAVLSLWLLWRRFRRPRLERKALRLLEELLAGEQLIASVKAITYVARQDRVAMILGGNYRENKCRYIGLLAIAESRLIFVARSFVRWRWSDEQLSDISSLSLNRAGIRWFRRSELQLNLTGDNEPLFFWIKTREVQSFFATAQDALANARARVPVPAPAVALSAADELAKLADLHRQGILSAGEFAEAKARLLG
jgi:hypothetical protein